MRPLFGAQVIGQLGVKRGVVNVYRLSGQLDPAVSEQLWLRVELKDERAAEFEHGRTARDAGDTRKARLSNLRRMWLESQLEAGRYDTSGEDRKAYLETYIQERAASIEPGDPEVDVQPNY